MSVVDLINSGAHTGADDDLRFDQSGERESVQL